MSRFWGTAASLLVLVLLASVGVFAPTAARTAFAAPINLQDYDACVDSILKKLVPDLEARQYSVSNQIKRFITSVKSDYFITVRPPQGEDAHFLKHQPDFRRIGLDFRSHQDYVNSAIEFGASTGRHRIVFRSKWDAGVINKVDLDDGRVLILNAISGKLITYYVIRPGGAPYGSFAEFAMRRLYLGEDNTAARRKMGQ